MKRASKRELKKRLNRAAEIAVKGLRKRRPELKGRDLREISADLTLELWRRRKEIARERKS